MIKKIIIIGLAPLYIFCFGEVFVRLLHPVSIVPRYVQATDYGIRGNEPNTNYWHIGTEYNVEVRVNSQGIRADREFPIQKPGDVYRIVLLGDSFGMGYEVSLEDSFASRLEHHFSQQTGLTCEVINLSTSGHGTAEQLLTLKATGLQFSPDLVLLSWHRTDYEDNTRSKLFKLENGDLVRAARTYLPGVEARKKLERIPLYTLLATRSQLFNFTREKAANIVKDILVMGRRSPSSNTIQSPEAVVSETPREKTPKSKYATPYEDQIAIELLHEIKRLSTEQGADFLILDVPHRLSRTEFISTLPPRIALEGAIRSYSPIADFQAHLGEKLYWEHGHSHFTPLACDVVGRGLAEEIIGLAGSTLPPTN